MISVTSLVVLGRVQAQVQIYLIDKSYDYFYFEMGTLNRAKHIASPRRLELEI